ncbi:MAG: hypothetical protein IME94_09325 [Proteobacteria bacterium]|nr:hypothetical protein [Pseudomonadota bacterium]
MKFQSKIIAPVTLSKNVLDIEFIKRISVSLDCSGCKRSRRTVVLFEEQNESFCTPTNHKYPGRINKLSVSERKKYRVLSDKSVVTATYKIVYEFDKFTDKKYPDRTINENPTWARVSFSILCKCGVKSEHSTQNNISRPWTAVCECGNELYYELEEIPKFTAG